MLNHQGKHLTSVRSVLSTLVSPVQYAINWPVQVTEWAQASFSGQQKLMSQNADLKVQVFLLKARLQKLLALEQENEQLRALLQSTPQTAAKVLVARILMINADPFLQQVVINQGHPQGLFVGQPVLDGSGVFGQVIQTNHYTSRVMLPTDIRSAIPIQDSRSGVRGIVVGNGDSTTMSLVNIPLTADIHVGDELVTSGLGDLFPVGYPVGKVHKIQITPGKQFAQITVLPSAHLNQSHLVLLLWLPSQKKLRTEVSKQQANNQQVSDTTSHGH